MICRIYKAGLEARRQEVAYVSQWVGRGDSWACWVKLRGQEVKRQRGKVKNGIDCHELVKHRPASLLSFTGHAYILQHDHPMVCFTILRLP